ncbi:MAG: aminoacyl-tRNA hydrolase [Microgenomates group bacterium]
MELVIGLGNPGEKYKNNRHNVGHMVVEALLKKNLPKNVVVRKTDVFMNESGKSMKKLINQYKIGMADLWVIHDDLDIALGQYKIQKGKGPKLHKGIDSIEKETGKDDFWRVRVGVENRPKDNRIPGEQYVLQDFLDEELDLLNGTVETIIKELILRIKE